MRVVVTFFLLLSAGAIQAAVEGPGMPSPWPKLIETLLWLLVVLAVILLLARATQRFKVLVPDAGTMSVLQVLRLGARERLILVRVADTDILMASTTGSLRVVHVFEQGSLGDQFSVTPGDSVKPGFDSLLRSFTGSGKNAAIGD